MKLIDLHEAWMKKGVMDSQGMCLIWRNHFSHKGEFSRMEFNAALALFMPDNVAEHAYWGYDGSDRNGDNNYMYRGIPESNGYIIHSKRVWFEYTPLRQTIVLFLSAMFDHDIDSKPELP